MGKYKKDSKGRSRSQSKEKSSSRRKSRSKSPRRRKSKRRSSRWSDIEDELDHEERCDTVRDYRKWKQERDSKKLTKPLTDKMDERFDAFEKKMSEKFAERSGKSESRSSSHSVKVPKTIAPVSTANDGLVATNTAVAQLTRSVENLDSQIRSLQERISSSSTRSTAQGPANSVQSNPAPGGAAPNVAPVQRKSHKERLFQLYQIQGSDDTEKTANLKKLLAKLPRAALAPIVDQHGGSHIQQDDKTRPQIVNLLADAWEAGHQAQA